LVELGNNQLNDGARALTISLASSPCDCHANVAPTPIRTAIKKRARERTIRLPAEGFLLLELSF